MPMLSLKIASRYLFAKKSHSAVNVISAVAVAGVAIATMAITIVLSVFNGFTDLAAGHLGRIDPDFKIVPVRGTTFAGADSLARELSLLPGIMEATPTLEQRALLIPDTDPTAQIPVKFKGVTGEYSRVTQIDSLVIDGTFRPDENYLLPAANLSVGVAVSSGLRPAPGMGGATLYVPRRQGRINPANPMGAYRSTPLSTASVFQVDQPEYDNDCVIIPLETAREILQYTHGEASAIEIALAPGTKADIAAIAEIVPDSRILNRQQQQQQAFKMIQIEKWVTFLMLTFILLIASFNIITTLSLLVIEKKSDIVTLRALGAPRHMITRIFVLEGWLITCAGGIIGTISGVLLSLLQQHLGLLKLNGNPGALTIDAYPVRVDASDTMVVMGAVVLTGALISIVALKITKKSA